MGDAAEKLDERKKWLTIGDAALHTGRSVYALHKAIERGQLVPDSPARKGWKRCHHFLRETLDAFMRHDATDRQ